jgi:hypothetical protein
MFGGVGQFFSRSFVATGGTPPYSFTNFYNLPAWLSGSATGVISGTISGGTFNYTNLIGSVTDSIGQSTSSVLCPLRAYAAPSFTACPPSGALIGSSYSADLLANVPNTEVRG